MPLRQLNSVASRSSPAALAWGLFSGLAIASAGWWPAGPRPITPGMSGFRPLGEALGAIVGSGPGVVKLDFVALALFVLVLCRWAIRAGISPVIRRLEPDFLVMLAFALVVHPAAAAALVVGGFTGTLAAGSLVLGAAQIRRVPGATWMAGGLVLIALLLAPEVACLLPVLLFPVEEDQARSDQLLEGPLLATLVYLGLRWGAADPGGAGLTQGGFTRFGLVFQTLGHSAWQALSPAWPATPPNSPVGFLALGGWPQVLLVGAGLCTGVAVIRDASRCTVRTRRLLELILMVAVAASLTHSGFGPLDLHRWLLPTLFTLATGLTIAFRGGRAAPPGIWLAAVLLIGGHLAVSLQGEPPRHSEAALHDVAIEAIPPSPRKLAELQLEDAEAALTRYDYYTARQGFLDLLETSSKRYRVLRGLVIANAGLGDVSQALVRTKECLELDPAKTRLDITRLLQPYFDDNSLADEGLEYLIGLEGLWSGEAWMQANFALLYARTGDHEAAARHRRREAEIKAMAPR